MKRYEGARRVIALAAGALLLAGAGAACAKKDTGGTTDSGVKLVKTGVLTTCTHLPYSPFQSKDAGGKVVGFDVDLIDLAAKKLGVTQEIIDTPFEGIQSGEDLNARKCDIAAAAMTITPERQEKIAFSAPYFDADQALLTKKGSGIDSLVALSGKTLGVQSGTTGKDYATENAKSAKLKDYEDLALQLSAVQNGQVDAAINDIPVLLDFAKNNPDVEVTATFKTGEKYGFGMKKGTSDELKKVVDEQIAAARKDGTYDQIYEKWFGRKPE
jgi:polar amino acid transport system substrate-binding protein